ncbi:glycosyltransferase [Arthrobacter sp. ATA002]|uniref:glycosyltransferase n=1 Tax=Arthrobacter sp. ATA002 TaxID=2991715 RepID=UPI0022A6E3DA|nr:glycosyltransferase [Arthrobacter sp. ATA002]WAP51157.1 glycosyltransferase [Arthrobacter sp. ATA002]
MSILMAHPSAELYGSDKMFLESAAGLSASGHSVTATLPQAGPLGAALRRVGVSVELCRTPVLRKSLLSPRGVLVLGRDSARGVLQAWSLLNRLRPDILYVSTQTIPLWNLVGRLKRLPVLVHVHEAEGSAPAIFRLGLALPLAAATAVVANSYYAAGVQERSFRPLKGRQSVVYNGVAGPAHDVEPRVKLQGTIRLVYVGRLSERKGVDVAVHAVLLLHAQGVPVSLDVVGAVYPGYEAFEARLRNTVSESGASDSVTFHGFQTDVWPFLANADIALIPSQRDEPFGNTAVEAMLAARPAVVSNTSGLREAAGGYGSVVFVEPGHAQEVARAVRRIRENWEQYRDSALTDAVTAAVRHSSKTYVNAVAKQLDAAVVSAGRPCARGPAL